MSSRHLAHTYIDNTVPKMNLALLGLEPNPLNKGSQESLDKMSYLQNVTPVTQT